MSALTDKLATGQDFSLTYDELAFEPSDDLQGYQQILAEAKSHGYGLTNLISDRRMAFWKRESPKGRN